MFHYSSFRLSFFRYPQDGYSVLLATKRAALVYQAPFTFGWRPVKVGKMYNLPYQFGELVNFNRRTDITYVQLVVSYNKGAVVRRLTGRVHCLSNAKGRVYVLEVIPYTQVYGMTLFIESCFIGWITRMCVEMDRRSILFQKFIHRFDMNKIKSFRPSVVPLGEDPEAWSITQKEDL
jgi:hypothetical protein